MTTYYHIYNANSGTDMGEYPGENELDAVHNMAMDAGYRSLDDMERRTGQDWTTAGWCVDLIPYDEDYSEDYARENEEAF